MYGFNVPSFMEKPPAAKFSFPGLVERTAPVPIPEVKPKAPKGGVTLPHASGIGHGSPNPAEGDSAAPKRGRGRPRKMV
jgi:hypothetical protein